MWKRGNDGQGYKMEKRSVGRKARAGTRPGSAVGVQPWPRLGRGWGTGPEMWLSVTPLSFLSLARSGEERKR